MSFQRFLILLSSTTISIVLINFTTTLFYPILKNYTGIAWWSLSLFVAISFLLYFLGTQAAKSTNKLLFNNVIIASVFFKMMAAIVILVIYKKIYHPQSSAFLIPFFIVYLFFSVFETYFMIKLSHQKKENQ